MSGPGGGGERASPGVLPSGCSVEARLCAMSQSLWAAERTLGWEAGRTWFRLKLSVQQEIASRGHTSVKAGLEFLSRPFGFFITDPCVSGLLRSRGAWMERQDSVVGQPGSGVRLAEWAFPLFCLPFSGSPFLKRAK